MLLAAVMLISFQLMFGRSDPPPCDKAFQDPLQWPPSLWQPVSGTEHTKGRRESFTVVLNTYERPDLLRRAVAHYSECPGVDMIRVVWSEQIPVPTMEDAPDAFGARPEMVRFDVHNTTSINNRFAPLDGLRTDAVFNVDDDMVIPCGALKDGFVAWKRNPSTLVGFFPRAHARLGEACEYDYVWLEPKVWWGGVYSIVLTKAAFVHARFFDLYTHEMPAEVRAYVDENHNCEDIAMQFLVSNATGLAPVYVRAPLWFYVSTKFDGVGRAGISGKKGHHRQRGQCITDFAAMYGGLPLQSAPLRGGGKGRVEARRAAARLA